MPKALLAKTPNFLVKSACFVCCLNHRKKNTIVLKDHFGTSNGWYLILPMVKSLMMSNSNGVLLLKQPEITISHHC